MRLDYPEAFFEPPAFPTAQRRKQKRVPACTCVSLRDFLKFVWLLSSYSARSRIPEVKRHGDYRAAPLPQALSQHAPLERVFGKSTRGKTSKSIDYAESREYKCTHVPFHLFPHSHNTLLRSAYLCILYILQLLP